MNSYTRTDVESFLHAVDDELSAECTVVMIGGAVIGLLFDPQHVTRDIDLWGSAPTELGDACEKARRRTGKAIPVDRVGIAEPPYDFEDRLQPLGISSLRRLNILVPEAHDLVLMKTARGDEHDMQGIEDIHRAKQLSLDTLLERYRKTDVTGSADMFKLKFLDVVARLFGEDAARRLEPSL